MTEVPWTQEQVDSLNKYKNAGYYHPFTCGISNCRAILVATTDGWKCPDCSYTQNWAHEFMFNSGEQ